MENVDEDSQFREPDTSENPDAASNPPQLTPLQIAQQQYQERRNWGTETLRASAAERRQVRKELLETREQRKTATIKLQSEKKWHCTIIKTIKAAEILLNQITAECNILQNDLDAELKRKPAVIEMSEKEKEELKKRVESMRSRLNAISQQSAESTTK